MIIKPLTWTNYLEHAKNKSLIPEKFLIDEVDKLINIQINSSYFLGQSLPVMYLLDYTTGRYLMVSQNCKTVMGFAAADIIDGGIGYFAERYHPEDLQIFNDQVFANIQKILKNISPVEHKDYIFSSNYRLKNGKGDYVNLLQKNSFIKSDINGNPLISLGMISKVDHFVCNNPVIQLVEKFDPLNGTTEIIVKNTYYLKEENKIFSKREKEILLHIAEGLTSKEIAVKLFISEHTVINHKRNMHSKSNTQNSAGLMSFAFSKNLL